jgi:hypothetical protein
VVTFRLRPLHPQGESPRNPLNTRLGNIQKYTGHARKCLIDCGFSCWCKVDVVVEWGVVSKRESHLLAQHSGTVQEGQRLTRATVNVNSVLVNVHRLQFFKRNVSEAESVSVVRKNLLLLFNSWLLLLYRTQWPRGLRN